MAFVLQMQRRAIEKFLPKSFIGWVRKNQKVFSELAIAYRNDCEVRFEIDSQRIYFWGISTGIGTCAGIHGMNVAVFGEMTDREEVRKPEVETCFYAVLVRKPEDG